jgi:FtsP/CotA-like multicopper oxidase with cupredoxin domain
MEGAIVPRKLAALVAALIFTFGLVGQAAPVLAKSPTAQGGSGVTMGAQKPMTNAQRKAAAVRAAKARIKAGGAAAAAIPGTNTKMLAGVTSPVIGGIPTGNPTNADLALPDYFGQFPNYANSPLPTSVSIQGDGMDAFATATVSGGVATGITLVNGGTNYTFANVVVIGGGGSGATGTAAITGGVITAIALGSGGSGYDTTPGIQKFVDALPQLGPTGANGLGQYLPVAVADTTTFDNTAGTSAPAADYYEIAVVQYQQQLNSSLPPTTLRGYVQISTTVVPGKQIPLKYPDGTAILDPSGAQVYAVDNPQYLGPVIVAQKDKPVRVKFDNYLPKGTGGSLFIPVDPTIMGAGMGPNGGLYSQDRATLHLHGGVTPWISDGTPDQWTTPVGSTEQYPKGVSTGYVPDMWYNANGNDVASCDNHTTCAVAGASTNPGQGQMTFYYTNQQSARLMFYHDHSYGTTRLNVYAGEAAGYLVQDPTEAALVANGTIPATQIPLVIQDKSFVPSPTQLAAEDPTWNTTYYGGYGSLWFPHVYMPNQNPGDMNGANAMGRWDYGHWFWPIFPTTVPESPNPLCPSGVQATCPGAENVTNPGVPNPSIVPESFMDTMMVNGTVYPYLNVGQQAVRFRILNASNDRSVNLSLYHAGTETNGAFVPCYGAVWTGTTLNANGCSGEVPMAPAVKGTAATAGYVYPDELDGRNGGVPDVRARGPQMIQIGTEGGFLSAPAVLPNQPVGYNYNRRDIVVLNVSTRNLTLGPAERADVVVDFSGAAVGDTFILYNDSPAPMPAFDSRYDYFTGDQDQVMNGGAPTTLPGYGPNTRTVMQIQVTGPATATSLTGAALLPALQAAIPVAYGQTQAAPVVPEKGYDAAFGTSSPADPYARIQSMQGTFNTGTVTSLTLTNGGSGYTSPPQVIISGGGGSGATAIATLNSGSGVASITLTNGGTGYTATPTVTLGPPDMTTGLLTQATAVATYSSSVVVGPAASLTAGSGYTSPPTVTFSGGGGAGAAATPALAPSGVASVAVTAPGGYTTVPTVAINATTPTDVGGGTATAILGAGPVASVNVTTAGSGYTLAPSVSFGGPGTGAAGTSTLVPTSVGSLTLTNPGSLYVSAPTVAFSGGGGTNAAASTTLSQTGGVGAINVTAAGTGYTMPPTISVNTPQLTGTRATAVVSAMQPVGVGSVRVTNGGSCVATTPVPTVTFVSVNGAGSGATGTATVGNNRRVSGITLTNPGTGYTLPPRVVFGGTNCTGETATTTLRPTGILAITVTNPGSGYTSAPRVSFQNVNGVGGGAAANSVLARPVASITLTNGGTGYTAPPTLALTAPQFALGVTATATAALNPTGVATVTMTAGGTGYTAPPQVTFTPVNGAGLGAAGSAALGPKVLASVTINAAGSYTTLPTVSFTNTTATDPGGATGTATLLPSTVASVTVTKGGAGYTSSPTLALVGGGGTLAAATVVLAGAPITGLTLTNAGSGYTVGPSVTITPAAGDLTGTGATGTTTGGLGTISAITLTNPGSGYVSAPTVAFGAPGINATATAAITVAPVTLAYQPMGIQELFDPFFGRMNATMSMEIPNTNGTIQTTIPYGYIDPPTELIDTNFSSTLPPSSSAAPLAMLPDGTQIWKFTHNGVDTHSVHFHMFNIELINRVGWDGAVRPPDPNEMGWKDTIRMSPLEDAIIAIKPIVPNLPWPLPNSIRPLDVTTALGTSGVQYTNVDPNGLPVTVVNHLINYGWEYVFHCHLLGHEENDMMRPMLFGIAPITPTIGQATASTVKGKPVVTVTFTDNSVNETGFTVQRSANAGATWTTVGTVARPAPVLNTATQVVTDFGTSVGTTVSFSDTTVVKGTSYVYRAMANDVIGDTSTTGFPSMSVDSVPSAASSSVTP